LGNTLGREVKNSCKLSTCQEYKRDLKILVGLFLNSGKQGTKETLLYWFVYVHSRFIVALSRVEYVFKAEQRKFCVHLILVFVFSFCINVLIFFF